MSQLQIDLAPLELDDPEMSQESRDKWEGVAAIYQDFIQPDSTLAIDEAVKRLSGYPVGNDGERWPVDYLAFHFGDQIPYDNPAHIKLAALLIAFCKTPQYVYKKDYSTELLFRLMNQRLRDSMKDPIWRYITGGKPIEYVNAQAFAANLMPKDSQSKQLLPTPLIMAHAAMEGAFGKSHDELIPALRDAWIMGAAQFILHRAEFIYSCVARPGYETSIEQSAILQAEKWWPLTLSDWKSWKLEFDYASRDDIYSPTCMTMAAEVVRLMESQDQTPTKRVPG